MRTEREDLAAFQKETKAARDAKLKGAVEAAIPVIEEHLKMAKNDSKKIGCTLIVTRLRRSIVVLIPIC